MPSQQVLQEKIEEVEEITRLIKKYKVIGLASLKKVRAAQLQEFKKKFANKIQLRVIKNRLMERAIKNCIERPEMQKMIEYLEGSIIFLLTDINPFKLAIIFQKERIKTTAKARDIAAFDVFVPSGNTGQPPGPVISHFNAVGLPTRIEAGSVWITRDTLVCKKGDEISQNLASILSKLGIKPVEVELKIIVAYDNGLVIPQEQLYVDISRIKQNIEEAHGNAFALSLSIVYPTLENIRSLIQVARRDAYNLSLNASIPTNETIVDLIKKAHIETLCLSSLLDSLQFPSK